MSVEAASSSAGREEFRISRRTRSMRLSRETTQTPLDEADLIG